MIGEVSADAFAAEAALTLAPPPAPWIGIVAARIGSDDDDEGSVKRALIEAEVAVHTGTTGHYCVSAARDHDGLRCFGGFRGIRRAWPGPALAQCPHARFTQSAGL